MPLNRDVIKQWIQKIANSELSVNDFFANYDVPFSRANYFRYKQSLSNGKELVTAQCGRKKKIGEREELFIRGVIARGDIPSVDALRQMIEAEFGTALGRTAMRRTLNRLFPNHERPKVGRPITNVPEISSNALGGFELIIAVAYHLKWPDRVATVINDCARDYERKAEDTQVRKERRGRNDAGHFTSEYNLRSDARTHRFSSIEEKRKGKRMDSMAIMKDQALTLSRKSLAILSLPVVTANGAVRNVNLALGQALGHLCGYDYKQATVTKFLSELKYLGIAERLLVDLPLFWKECWGEEMSASAGSITCYYVDGNTKAVWSSKRVKQNKVAMLGRVMGCLEQVFIHDGLGHPIYFETHSGHGPVGEDILGLFEKIESTIMDVPGSRTQVCRAIVMDAASNSVGTLRAFAAQEKYHFITSLDDNQWSERKVCSRGYPCRYRYGTATLRDLDIELADSNDNKYLIVSRAVKINWDNGKQTVLLTSLPRSMVDASEVVYAYFRRWPAQELAFRRQKAAVALNRVCGYGKKFVSNERVREQLEKLTIKKQRLEVELNGPIVEINEHDAALATLIVRERRLRQKTKVADGERIVPDSIKQQLAELGAEIKRREIAKAKIEKEHPKAFMAYRKTMKEWLRLQSKTMVYALDVELDQILTYYRACLVHLCAYFIRHFLGVQQITYAMLFHRINQLQAQVEINRHMRKVTLTANTKDPAMMTMLHDAVSKLNGLKIRGDHGRVYQFVMK